MSTTQKRFNWIGLAFTIGGLILAGLNPEPVLLGIPAGGWLALFGSGVVRFDQVIPTKTRTP